MSNAKVVKERKPVYKKNDKDKKKRTNKRSASEAFEGNTNKSCLDQKVARKERNAQKPHYELVTRAKQLWNLLRERKIDKEKRAKLSRELFEVVKDNIYQVAAKHDASRVIQGLFRHGTREHRIHIVSELKDHIVELSKVQYGSFLVKKILKYGSEQDRAEIAKAFSNHAVSIGTHSVAASVFESALEYLPAPQFWPLKAEFYGKEFAYFASDIKDRNLNGLLAKYPDKKEIIMKNLFGILTRMVDKELLGLAFVQSLMWDYISNANYEQVKQMTGNIRDASLVLLATGKGAYVVNKCVAFGDVKDRKRIVKCLKDKVMEATNHPSGYIVIQRILDVVDDTVLIQKSILNELQENLFDVTMHATGRKVLLQLLSPLNPKYLSPDEIALLAQPLIPDPDNKSENAQIVNYKKDPAVKREAILRMLLPKLEQMCCEHMHELLCSKNGRDILFEVMKESYLHNNPGTKQLEDALISLLRASKEHEKDTSEGECSESSQKALYAHPIAHYALRRIIKETAFAKALLRELKDHFPAWATSGNRGSFILLSFLESPECQNESSKVLKSALKPHKSALHKMAPTHPGVKLLLEKL